jgi:hypothetical protein
MSNAAYKTYYINRTDSNDVLQTRRKNIIQLDVGLAARTDCLADSNEVFSIFRPPYILEPELIGIKFIEQSEKL